jgi:hypothetical protein
MLPDSWKSIAHFQGYKDPPVCPSDKTSIEIQTSMEHYCDNIELEQPNCSQRNRLTLVLQAVGSPCLGGQGLAMLQPCGLTSYLRTLGLYLGEYNPPPLGSEIA